MIRGEYRKILGQKLFCLSFVFLFILNGIVCFLSMRQFPDKEVMEDIDSLFQLYCEDSSTVVRDYEKYRELVSLNELAWREALEAGNYYEEPIPISATQ